MTDQLNQQTTEADDKARQNKARLNIVYVSMISVFMLFGGLTSGYIVSMGDSFWLKFPLPTPFWISTGLIIFSSIFLVIAVKSSKLNKDKVVKVSVLTAFVLGVLFVYFQFKGYGELVANGVHAGKNYILVTEGKYGDYYEVKYKGDFIEVNGNEFLLKGKEMNDVQLNEYQKFMSQFEVVSETKPFQVNQYGKDFILYFENSPLSLVDGKLRTEDNKDIQYLDRERLAQLARNVGDLRGDFYVKGKLGEDFHVYYKGKELGYKNRELVLDGKQLMNHLQIKSMESADQASSYLYIITFMHLLHVFGTLFYLMRVVIRSFTGGINEENMLRIRMGAVFWHFLGFLWVFLLLFLLFIH